MDPTLLALLLVVVLVAHGPTLCVVVSRSEMLVDLARALSVAWLVVCVLLTAHRGGASQMVSDVGFDAMAAWVVYRISGRFDLTWAMMFVWIVLSWLGGMCRGGA